MMIVLLYLLLLSVVQRINIFINHLFSVSGKNARKGPLPDLPNTNEVIPHGVRADKAQDSDNLNSHPKDEFSAGAKVSLDNN